MAESMERQKRSNFERELNDNAKDYGGFYWYQAIAGKTAVYPGHDTGSNDAIAYVGLGLASEAGEVAGKLKKYQFRGDDLKGKDLRDLLTKELGGVLWYIARICSEYQIDLHQVALLNLGELRSRQERGVLKGEGDDR